MERGTRRDSAHLVVQGRPGKVAPPVAEPDEFERLIDWLGRRLDNNGLHGHGQPAGRLNRHGVPLLTWRPNPTRRPANLPLSVEADEAGLATVRPRLLPSDAGL